MELLKEHNKALYEKMSKYLQEEGKACVILGTGLGKTTTALQYLYDHWTRGLIIVPNNTVKKSWNNSICDCVTYTYFMKHHHEIDYSLYGLVVLDEVHHIGADKWGEGVQQLLACNLIPVLGLTATPTRADMIDIRTYFEGNICEGLDVFEGIKQGILYPFSYVKAYYDANEIVTEAQNHYARLDTKLKGLLDLALNNTPSVKQIIRNNMPSGLRKGIVFVSRISEVEEAQNLLHSIYPDAPIKTLHSKMSDVETKNVTDWFYKIAQGYLITINMMGEGAHFPGVNTLIMLRKTTSNLVFTQQLGRCLTLTDEKKDGQSIVFDLVNNSNNLKNFKKNYEKILRERKQGRGETVYSDQMILKCYTEEVDKILQQIKNLYGYGWDSWSEQEIEILQQIPSLGIRKVSELLHKPYGSVVYAAQHFHIPYSNYHRPVYCIETDTEYANIAEAAKKTHVSEHSIRNSLKTIKKRGAMANSLHFCYASEKTAIEVKKPAQERDCVCVNTGKYYKTITQAAQELNISSASISNVCRHKQKTAKGLTFVYTTEYSPSLQPNICQQPSPKRVRCIETKREFDSIAEAGRFFNCSAANVIIAIKRGIKCKNFHLEFVEET